MVDAKAEHQRRRELERDYRQMPEMIFGEGPTFEELKRTVDNVMEEINDLLRDDADWGVDAVRGTDELQRLSEGEQARVLAAIELELGDASRFTAVPRFESR